MRIFNALRTPLKRVEHAHCTLKAASTQHTRTRSVVELVASRASGFACLNRRSYGVHSRANITNSPARSLS